MNVTFEDNNKRKRTGLNGFLRKAGLGIAAIATAASIGFTVLPGNIGPISIVSQTLAAQDVNKFDRSCAILNLDEAKDKSLANWEYKDAKDGVNWNKSHWIISIFYRAHPKYAFDEARYHKLLADNLSLILKLKKCDTQAKAAKSARELPILSNNKANAIIASESCTNREIRVAIDLEQARNRYEIAEGDLNWNEKHSVLAGYAPYYPGHLYKSAYDYEVHAFALLHAMASKKCRPLKIKVWEGRNYFHW